MDDAVKPRSYASPARRAQSDATRTRIAGAAAELFVAEGYAGTTMRAVAERAGVSEASVFAKFGSKARLFLLVVREQVANDADFPLSGNSALHPGQGVAEAAAALARIARRAHERSWRLLSIGATAAAQDAELADAMERGAEGRHDDIAWFVGDILEVAPARRAHVTDAIWTVAGVDDYRRLVVERGWPAGDFEDWLTRLIVAIVRDD